MPREACIGEGGAPPDALLVEAALRQDLAAPTAFRRLFERHVRGAAGLAYRLLGDERDVDDVVQESFAEALAKLGTLREPQAFGGWLAAIITAQVVRTIRRRRLLRKLGFGRDDASAPLPVTAFAPAEVVAELRAVYAVLESLPAEERVMLVLHRVEELTHEAIAAQMGCSIATVKRRIDRAEHELRRQRGGTK